jgi:EAL domain-containing protein (putative c-di-GMP-specific phosphodiesterase class I)
VKAVVSYCHQTDISVVAEGVEDESQLLAMNELGCNNIQGYYYSKPLMIEDVKGVINNWVHKPLN